MDYLIFQAFAIIGAGALGWYSGKLLRRYIAKRRGR